MFANSDKFQAIVVHHNKHINENYTLKANNIEIESKKFCKLLGIEIDNELLFNKHSALLCKKSGQSVRLQNQMGKMEKEI